MGITALVQTIRAGQLAAETPTNMISLSLTCGEVTDAAWTRNSRECDAQIMLGWTLCVCKSTWISKCSGNGHWINIQTWIGTWRQHVHLVGAIQFGKALASTMTRFEFEANVECSCRSRPICGTWHSTSTLFLFFYYTSIVQTQMFINTYIHPPIWCTNPHPTSIGTSEKWVQETDSAGLKVQPRRVLNMGFKLWWVVGATTSFLGSGETGQKRTSTFLLVAPTRHFSAQGREHYP
jgi:hypothetical protein